MSTGGSRARRRVVARGEVQGVFFRDSARTEAERRGVSGWIANRDDGSVEAVFEGEPEAVDRWWSSAEAAQGAPRSRTST